MPNMIVVSILLIAASAFAEEKHEGHEHNFSRDVDAFHGALAPLWHAQSGIDRSRQVCVQANKLENLAKGIQGADTKPLVDSIAALRLECQMSPAKIDAAFAQVHEAFHHVVASKGHQR